MFDGLSDRLGGIFDKLKKRGALSESDVESALREIRVALLEADVALPVVKDFIEGVKERALGEEVIRSVTPGQMVVSIVHEHLVEMLNGGPVETDASDVPILPTGSGLNLVGTPPVAILMVGLQGSGKTTTTGKIAARLTTRDKKKVLMASLDVYRPAAQQQLVVLGEQTNVRVLNPVMGEQPVAIAKRAMQTGRLEGFDVVLLDTAGRLHIDMELMGEVSAIRDVAKPVETLLVTDAMTGQDAVNVAREFNEKIGVTGIVLTRVDGDARGGAALSMRAVAGCPIKLMGTGENIDALDNFDAGRVAGSILGMGDVVGLVEKARDAVDEEEAGRLAKRMMKGQFSMDDMAAQLTQLRGLGDMNALMGMIPGINKAKKQMAEANVNDKMIAHQEAIIRSMTKKERKNPKLINGSRRKRIAAGSGTSVQEVNRLMKQFKQMSTMMKKMGKGGMKSMMSGMIGGGGMPPGMMPR
ncbi:MAG: signal recognition particle protein [Rhodospirillales bacterium]|jgi:signal recognition particle subunit SRP54|nr:signal recognition particle protein [Rhodospirillales bacterium]MBT4626434.1 signal recognition particle protein [Rhodospirillales bacterium]MBT5350883.1 signal recognition particle protein [Rhodospirillales bacterium]MBT5520678.1 signal recognition particle protein [Rhodospirillales bacterium]MBT6111241.1 signal recognition particle protein [Rhodospirillales bacterium]